MSGDVNESLSVCLSVCPCVRLVATDLHLHGSEGLYKLKKKILVVHGKVIISIHVKR